jgi:hypothetical protein
VGIRGSVVPSGGISGGTSPTGSGGGGTSSSGLPTGWVDITAAPYNCVGDGATDNTVGLQAAFDHVKAVQGGTIYVPPGKFDYRYLLVENTYGWQLQGAGPNQQYQTGPSRLRCTGKGGIRVTFTGTLANANLAMITIGTGSLTGKGFITGYTDGGGGVNERQDIIILATAGTYTLTYSGQTTGPIAYNASPATVQTALEGLSNIGVGQVSCAQKGGFGFMIARSSNFTISGIGLDYTDAAFGGSVLSIDGGFNGTEDCANWTIERVGTKNWGGGTAESACIRVSRGIIASIERCQFGSGQAAIVLGDPGGQFVNNFAIEKCLFAGAIDTGILVGSGDAEGVTVRDCCFEAGTNTTAIRGTSVAVDGGQHQTYNMMIENNWFGDSSGNQKWIDSLSTQSNSYYGTIAKNRFAGVGTTGTHLTLNGKWLVYGNTFEGGTLFKSSDPTHFGAVVFGNHYNVATVWDPSSFPTGAPDSVTEYGNTGGRIGMSSSAPLYIGSSSPDNTTRASIVISGSGWDPGTVNKSAISHQTVPRTTTQMIGVQAPWSGSGGAGQLLAGSGPVSTPMFWWQDKQLAFFGMSPVSMPASTGTATGFTAGAGTAVNDQSTFTGGVGLAAPGIFSNITNVGAGSFAAGTYFWKITATNAAGETTGSNEVSATVALNDAETISWTRVPGATGYKVYRSTTSGGQSTSPALVASVGAGTGQTVTYQDTGSAVGAGAVPAASTALTAYRVSDVVKALKQLGLMSA